MSTEIPKIGRLSTVPGKSKDTPAALLVPGLVLLATLWLCWASAAEVGKYTEAQAEAERKQ